MIAVVVSVITFPLSRLALVIPLIPDCRDLAYRQFQRVALVTGREHDPASSAVIVPLGKIIACRSEDSPNH
ncbi:MAG: hypothetical protein IJ242_06680 [Clostridia bacterium]|nr:hypothetical protein [Clostridia bacterium]